MTKKNLIMTMLLRNLEVTCYNNILNTFKRADKILERSRKEFFCRLRFILNDVIKQDFSREIVDNAKMLIVNLMEDTLYHELVIKIDVTSRLSDLEIQRFVLDMILV